MGLLSKIMTKTALTLGCFALVSSFSTDCFASKEFDLSDQEVIAVSSLENSTSISFDFPDNDPLSVHLLSMSRGTLFCESQGYTKAVKWTHLQSFESKEFTVYETKEPSSMRLPVLSLIEFINKDTGEVIMHGKKSKLPLEEANKYVKLFSKKPVPHLLFEKITCEE